MSTAEHLAGQILREHREGQSCCHADRGPCVYGGTVSLCGAATCSRCAPSPWSKKPEWPCLPVKLARAVLPEPPS